MTRPRNGYQIKKKQSKKEHQFEIIWKSGVFLACQVVKLSRKISNTWKP